MSIIHGFHTERNGFLSAGGRRITSMEKKDLNYTDTFNAERFAEQYGDKARWCSVWNCWMVFDGRCWQKDTMGIVARFAKSTVRSMYIEAGGIEGDATRIPLGRHALRSESSRARHAMLDLAKSELPVSIKEFDTHLHLFNWRNGTLDLKTGDMR